jgi:hypothetical protein
LSTTVASSLIRFRGSIRGERSGCMKVAENEKDRQGLLT